MLRKILSVAISLALIASLLTGCLPAGTPSAISGQAEEVAAADGFTLSEAEGKVLNLYGIDPQTLDPAITSDGTSHGYILQIFSGLVTLGDNLEAAPDIAKDWLISADGKTYTFHLRQDVRFQDGRGVKAADFKYSWERAADPATGSLTAANYLGDIVGVKAALSGQSRGISGVKIIDDYTLEVTIDAPKSYFLSKLTYPTAFVIDSNNVKSGKDWWLKPNGTGPFKLQAWDKTNRLTLVKNDLYYGRLAEVDTVIFQLFSGIPMNMYETAQIDATGVSVPYIDRVTDKAGPFYDQLTTTPELSFSFIGFNTSKPPFDDANIRRAFSLAIDKDKLVSLIFRDSMERADGILPPGIPGFNKDLTGLTYDVSQAKKLIGASKYGSVAGLPPITVTTSGWGAEISSDLEAIIYQWRQNLGVEVTVRQLEPERYFYHLKEERDEMFDMGWVADYPHPQNFLEILFRSGSQNNYGDYANPEVDALLAQAGTELDGAKSRALYQQAEQKLVDDAAVIPLWFGRNFTLAKPYLKGYDLNPMGLVMLNKVTVEAH
ncbi:MAG: peptide ABC transporter substrate-binding protein [Chloroflexi bacterium]|nr:peptide ABC transporter substrate-binding protein [Chloroflexota bacterium]